MKTARTGTSKATLLQAVQSLDLTATKRILAAKPALGAAIDRQGRNILHVACSVPPAQRVSDGGQARFVSYLLDQHFEIDQPVGRDKCTALFFAVARARNPTLVKLLLGGGAKVDAAPGGGLFAAGWWDDVKNLKLLIDAGARLDVVVGVTPFLASWCWRKFEAAKYLVLRGADVNYQDKKGRTALHHGIEKEFDPQLLQWLVEHGARPDVADREGVTPQLRAARKRDQRFLAALGRAAT